MLQTKNTTTSQNWISIVGSKHAPNSAWNVSWHLLKAFLHLSQACFRCWLHRGTHQLYIHKVVRFCMLNVNTKQQLLVWGQILISVASCSFAGVNRCNWAEVKVWPRKSSNSQTVWSQRPDFSLTQQSATPSRQLNHVKIYVQKHNWDYSSLFTSKTIKQSAEASRESIPAAPEPQDSSVVWWEGLEPVGKVKDPAGHSWHPCGREHCRGSGAAVGAGAAPSWAGCCLLTLVGAGIWRRIWLRQGVLTLCVCKIGFPAQAGRRAGWKESCGGKQENRWMVKGFPYKTAGH